MVFNSVLKYEMKRMARSRQMLWIVFAFNIIMAGAALLIYENIRLMNESGGISVWLGVDYLFAVIITIEICMLTLFVPPIAGGSIAGEYEHQTIEILLSSKLAASEIVAGKLLSSISLALLLMVSSLPVDMMIMTFGGLSITSMFKPLLYTAFFALLAGSIGVFFSCFLKRTTPATIATYGLILFLTIGLLVLPLAMQVIFGNVAGMKVILYILFYMMLLDPALTFSMIVMQIFEAGSMLDFFTGTLIMPPFIMENWILLSIAAQIIMIAVLIFFSIRKLDPLTTKRRRKDG